MSIFSLKPLGNLTMTELSEAWDACQVLLLVLGRAHHHMEMQVALLSADISLEISDRHKSSLTEEVAL